MPNLQAGLCVQWWPHALRVRACALVAALALALLAARAWSQAAISVSVSDLEPVVLQTVQLRIEVQDGALDEAPQIPAVDGLTVRFAGPSTQSFSSISFVNGRMRQVERQDTTYTYLVTPTRPGTFEIPAMTVKIGGGERRTDAIRITATEAKPNADFVLAIEPARDRAVVGEWVPVRVTWYVGGAASRNPRPRLVVSSSPELEIRAAPMAGRIGARDEMVQAAMSIAGDTSGSEREVLGVVGEGQLGGRSFLTVSFDLLVSARSAGAHEVGPITAVFVVTNRRDMFDPGREVVIASESSTIEFGELPKAGRPAGFRGLIGRYTAEASASPTDVAVGDPITLRLVVRGGEQPARTLLPDLSEAEGFAGVFRASPEGWESQGEVGDGYAFTTTIRALEDGVERIPPIELGSFDPVQGKYVVERTRAIPISVRAARVVTLDDAVVSGSAAKAAASRPVLIGRPAGMVANRYGSEATRASVPPVGSAWAMLQSPGAVAGIAGPPMLAAVAWLVAGVRAKRRDGTLSRRARAVRAAGALVNANGAARAAAAREFVAALSTMDAAAVTARDCHRVIGVYDEGCATDLARMLELEESRQRVGPGDTHGASGVRCDVRKALLRVVDVWYRSEAGRRGDGAASRPTVAAALLVAMVAAWTVPAARAQGEGAIAAAEAAHRAFDAGVAAADDPAAAGAHFDEAAAMYARAIELGARNGSMLLNLGNAHLLAGRLGDAVLAYRRAERLEPGDRGIAAALAHARAQVGVRVRPSGMGRVTGWLTAWRDAVPRAMVVWFGLAGWAVGWLVVAARAMGVRRAGGWGGAAAGAGILCALVAAGLLAVERTIVLDEDAAVVMRPARAMQGPGEALYEPAFDRPLEPGMEVRVLEERGAWWRVSLSDGREAWSLADAMQRVEARADAR